MLTGIQLLEVAKRCCHERGLDPAELVIGENGEPLPRWRAMIPEIRRYERIMLDVLTRKVAESLAEKLFANGGAEKLLKDLEP